MGWGYYTARLNGPASGFDNQNQMLDHSVYYTAIQLVWKTGLRAQHSPALHATAVLSRWKIQKN